MQTLKKQLQQNLALLLFGTLFSAYHPAMAESDQEMFLKAREMQQKTDHAGHAKPIDKSLDFHGVFLGFLPCNDCLGIKETLSLNANNNYLLVVQDARPGARESYEKGKYRWDDEKHTVALTPRKGKGIERHYLIEDENLIQLNSDGTRMMGAEADRYILRRTDTVKSRQVHIH